jgi:hypothetical protein
MAKRPTVGLLRLESSGGFNIEPTTFRWFDHSSRQLICINEAATSEPCDRLRLQITRDVDLLFANGKLCGWILSHSVNYLVNAWEAPYKNEPNDDLANLLHEYLELISDPNIERMEDEDPNILQKLLDLRTRAGHSQSSQQQRILYSSIEGILDLFYDKAL